VFRFPQLAKRVYREVCSSIYGSLSVVVSVDRITKACKMNQRHVSIYRERERFCCCYLRRVWGLHARFGVRVELIKPSPTHLFTNVMWQSLVLLLSCQCSLARNLEARSELWSTMCFSLLSSRVGGEGINKHNPMLVKVPHPSETKCV
jgi:hypothetical protein